MEQDDDRRADLLIALSDACEDRSRLGDPKWLSDALPSLRYSKDSTKHWSRRSSVDECRFTYLTRLKYHRMSEHMGERSYINRSISTVNDSLSISPWAAESRLRLSIIYNLAYKHLIRGSRFEEVEDYVTALQHYHQLAVTITAR